jgi:hypothetical protein
VVEEARRIKLACVIDGELVCAAGDGRADFDGCIAADTKAAAYAFDLLRLDGVDLRRLPFTWKMSATKCSRPPASSGWRAIVSKRLSTPYKSGPAKAGSR